MKKTFNFIWFMSTNFLSREGKRELQLAKVQVTIRTDHTQEDRCLATSVSLVAKPN